MHSKSKLLIKKWESKKDRKGSSYYFRNFDSLNSSAVMIKNNFRLNVWELCFFIIDDDKNFYCKTKDFCFIEDAAIYADLKLIELGYDLELPMFFSC